MAHSETQRTAIARRAVARIQRACAYTTMPGASADVAPSAMITGATGGIGRAIAGRLARAGYRLTLSGRDKAALAQVASDLADSDAEMQVVSADMTPRTMSARWRAVTPNGSVRWTCWCSAREPGPAAASPGTRCGASTGRCPSTSARPLPSCKSACPRFAGPPGAPRPRGADRGDRVDGRYRR